MESFLKFVLLTSLLLVVYGNVDAKFCGIRIQGNGELTYPSFKKKINPPKIFQTGLNKTTDCIVFGKIGWSRNLILNLTSLTASAKISMTTFTATKSKNSVRQLPVMGEQSIQIQGNVSRYFELKFPITGTSFSLMYTQKKARSADVDECASAADNNCHADATCTNNVGSFTCACNWGYFGNGKKKRKRKCVQCEIFTDGVCYWTIVGSRVLNSVGRGPEQRCANKGSELAYFADEKAYNAVVENIRSKLPEGQDHVHAFTALKFDPETGKRTYPSEDTYVKWKTGFPADRWAITATLVHITVLRDPSAGNQGMYNAYPYHSYHAIICQIKTV